MLFDLKSKFGTLIKDSKANFPLKKNVKFSIQSGSSIISFNLIKRSSENMFQSEKWFLAQLIFSLYFFSVFDYYNFLI